VVYDKRDVCTWVLFFCVVVVVSFNLYLKSCFSSFFVGVWMVAGKMSLKKFYFYEGVEWSEGVISIAENMGT